MITKEEWWEYYHHQSHLPDQIKYVSNEPNHLSIVDFLSNFVFIDIVYSEWNLSNIKETISINILTKPGILENINVVKTCSPLEHEIYHAIFCEFHDIFAWSYEEMWGIDSSILEHNIKMYPNVKLVQQHLRPVHPKKDAAIKAEIEKLLHVGFIYPIPLPNWVSNLVPVIKKQGTIWLWIDYMEVNKACPKYNYPTSFIDQVIDDCAGCEIFSFIDSFSGYNQIKIFQENDIKLLLFVPGAHSHIRNSLLVWRT